MMEFIIANYIYFIIAGVVLLLGLFGYIMDRRKYRQYRDEILKEGALDASLMNRPELSNVAKRQTVAKK